MITEDQHNKLKQTLATAGWLEVMYPALMNRGKQALKALVLSPSERVAAGGEFKDMDDSDLRSILRDVEWMTVCWQNEIAVFEHNRRTEELERQQNGAINPA